MNQWNRDLRVAEAIAIGGNLALDHGDFVTLGEHRAADAVFVNFVGKLLAAGDFESEVREKFRRAREETDAGDALARRFVHESIDESAAGAVAFRVGGDGDGANFRQMHAVEVQRTAADHASVLFSDNEVADVFGELGFRAWEQRALVSIWLNDGVDVLHVWQNRVACANHRRLLGIIMRSNA